MKLLERPQWCMRSALKYLSARHAWLAIGIGLATGTLGCASTQRVAYSVDQVSRSKGPAAPRARLMIRPLRDVRRQIAGNSVLFRSSEETDINGEPYCVNAETHYEPNAVGAQVADALVQHLRKRGALRAVSIGERKQDAYYLSGTLRRFYAMQKSTSTSPMTGALFGLAGVAVAAAATPDKTPGTVSIEMVDWILYDRQGNQLVRLPELRYDKQLQLPAAADCLVVYENINRHLKWAFDTHVDAIEQAIAHAETGAEEAPLGTKAEPFGPPPDVPW